MLWNYEQSKDFTDIVKRFVILICITISSYLWLPCFIYSVLTYDKRLDTPGLE